MQGTLKGGHFTQHCIQVQVISSSALTGTKTYKSTHLLCFRNLFLSFLSCFKGFTVLAHQPTENGREGNE